MTQSIAEGIYNSYFCKATDETARFFPESEEGCCVKSVGIKEKSENVRITYINGICNTREHATAMARRISISHLNNIVHSFCDPTNGIVRDLFDSFKLLCFGSQLDSVKKLTFLWRGLLAEMKEGKIIHYAHSRGGLVTKVALSNLTPEEKGRIEIILLGSPAMIEADECGDIQDMINGYDPVPYLNPKKWMDTLSCLGTSRLTVIGEAFEHSLEGNYFSKLIEMGDKVVEKFFLPNSSPEGSIENDV